MIARETVKRERPLAGIVGVIFSARDLERADSLPTPPDFFELRLDALQPLLTRVELAIPKLGAPLIITARRPDEGGRHQLSPASRRGLLARFLPYAHSVDLELRSWRELLSISNAARKLGVRRIVSVHHLNKARPLAQLDKEFLRAQKFRPDLYKLAVRTDTRRDLDNLLRFFETHQRGQGIAVMGLGRLGQESRRRLVQLGSSLHYGHLGNGRIAGQLSVTELQRLLVPLR